MFMIYNCDCVAPFITSKIMPPMGSEISVSHHEPLGRLTYTSMQLY